MSIKSIVRCRLLKKHDWRMGDGFAICRDCGDVQFLEWWTTAQSAGDDE